MGISVLCKTCNKKYVVKDSLAGKKIKCPGCSEVLTIPVPQQEGKHKAMQEPAELGFADEDDSIGAVCPGCGKEVPAGTKICIDCGYHFVSGTKLTTLDVDKYLNDLENKKTITIPRPNIMYFVGGFIVLIGIALVGFGIYGNFFSEMPGLIHMASMSIGGIILMLDILYFMGKRMALTSIRVVYAALAGLSFVKLVMSLKSPVLLLIYGPIFLVCGFLAIMALNPKNDDYCIL